MLHKIIHHSKRYKHHIAISTLVIILGLSTFLYLNSGCGSKPLESLDSSKVSYVKGDIRGQVFNQAGEELSGAVISIGKLSTNSDVDGSYKFLNIVLPARVLINASMDDYIPTQQVIVSPPANPTLITNIYLHQEPAPLSLDISVGDTRTDGQSQITVIAGTTMEDSNGNPVTSPVDVTLTTFDPSDSTDINMFPGIFAGRTSPRGADQPFESFGFINVSITKNGEKVNLAHGATAEIIIPIPAGLLSRAPDPIELWSYDETGGYWIQTGIATKDGSNYVAVVTHFSWMNWDWSYAGRTGYIKGRMIYDDGSPVTGYWAAAIGIGYTGHGACWLESDGTFTIPVLCNIAKEITIWGLPYGVSISSVTTNEPLIAGTTYTLPSDILVTDERRSATTVETVTLSPSSAAMLTGDKRYFSAAAKNNFDVVLPGKSFTWWSSNNAVATVDASGISVEVWAMSPGTCTIYSSCEGKTGSATLNVYNISDVATVQVLPEGLIIGLSSVGSFTAVAKNVVGTVLPGKSFTWWSSNTGIGTVDATGTTVEARGVSYGQCTIYASCEGKTGSAILSVYSSSVAYVQITPSSTVCAVSANTSFTATARDNSYNILPGKSFDWWTSNTGIATIDATGTTVEAWGISVGTCTIVACCESVVGTAELDVF